MGVRATVTVTLNFDRTTTQVLSGARDGVAAAGEKLLGLSAAIVPHDWGTLAGSGTVSPPLGSTHADPVAEVVYDTPYAARLHEHPEYNFQNGRQGKYLETPALENKDELGEIIAEQIRRAGG